MTSSEAIERVEAMCGGQKGFTEVYRAVGEPWDTLLEEFCLQKITPEQYLTRSTRIYLDYSIEIIVVDQRNGR